MSRRVVVAGAGVSGRSAAEALLADGAEVTVTDAAEDRLAQLTSLAERGVTLAEGLTEPPEGTDLVVTSPGWRPDTPLLTAAAAAGIEVIGEIELAWRMDRRATGEPGAEGGPAVWLCVTGTNGKTTTVGMLESILNRAGLDAVACGNVGLPAVDAVRAGHRVLAVELSSFQLHWSSTLAPHAAVVLNLADDHLDWHGSLEAYGAAKGTVYTDCGVAVFNADDEWSSRLAAWSAQRERARPHGLVGYRAGAPESGELGVVEGALWDRAFGTAVDEHGRGVELAALTDVHPAGPHNVSNALAAAALARAFGVPPEAVADGLREYQPGAHRSVPVAEHRGVVYVDDSKATNPHAAGAALGAHDRVVWIAGGLLKGAEVDGLVAEHAERLEAVVLIGRDRDDFARALARHAPDVPVHEVTSGQDEDMVHAVRLAAECASRGSAVVLAPAAASMDMFTDYAHRGRAFTEAVHRVVETPPAEHAGGPGR